MYNWFNKPLEKLSGRLQCSNYFWTWPDEAWKMSGSWILNAPCIFFIPGPSSLGAKWFRYRVSIYHPLGFNGHPLEGAGMRSRKAPNKIGTPMVWNAICQVWKISENTDPKKHSTWKWMVGIWSFVFWDGLCSGANMFVSGRVFFQKKDAVNLCRRLKKTHQTRLCSMSLLTGNVKKIIPMSMMGFLFQQSLTWWWFQNIVHPENWDSMIPNKNVENFRKHEGFIASNKNLRKPDRLTHDDYVRELEARLQARTWTGKMACRLHPWRLTDFCTCRHGGFLVQIIFLSFHGWFLESSR